MSMFKPGMKVFICPESCRNYDELTSKEISMLVEGTIFGIIQRPSQIMDGTAWWDVGFFESFWRLNPDGISRRVWHECIGSDEVRERDMQLFPRHNFVTHGPRTDTE